MIIQHTILDCIHLIQTAHDALSDVQSLLNCMIELAETCANGAVQNEVISVAV